MFSFFQDKKIHLSDDNIKVHQLKRGIEIPYKIHTMGLYLVIEAKNGLVLVWNRKTTVMIRLQPTFKVGEPIFTFVAILLGFVLVFFFFLLLFDWFYSVLGKTLRSVRKLRRGSTEWFYHQKQRCCFQSHWFCKQLESVQRLPRRRGRKKCLHPVLKEAGVGIKTLQHHQGQSVFCLPFKGKDGAEHLQIKLEQITCYVSLIILSFEKVDPESYFVACVKDTCSCNGGGDCDCFCSTVAAYAAACNEAGICVKWRTPSICRESLV